MTEVVGWEARRPDGSLIVDGTKYISQILGSFTTGAMSGSFVDPQLIGRRIVPFVLGNLSLYGGPDISSNPSNGLVTWVYNINTSGTAVPPAAPTETILYGAY